MTGGGFLPSSRRPEAASCRPAAAMDHLAQAYRSTGNAEKAEAVERQIAETQALQERLAQ